MTARTAGEVTTMTGALWAGIQSGRLPLPVRAHLALSELAEALRLAVAGGPGKVVLTTARPE
jgi:hypothetical protein